MRRTLAWLFTLIAALPAAAEQSKQFGDYEVHYNALPTSELAPDVARAYKLERSPNRGLVTIAVLKKNNLGVMQPIKANLRVHAVNLAQQLKRVPMREIKEKAATYYIGDLRIDPPERITLQVQFTPEGGPTQSFEFDQSFP